VHLDIASTSLLLAFALSSAPALIAAALLAIAAAAAAAVVYQMGTPLDRPPA
jgi:hypothetical protein